MSFMRYQGMVYLLRSLVGSFCYAKLVMSYPAWSGIYVIMCKIQIPLSFSSFWYCIVERKNSCFIVRRCLNRYKIDKFCTIERRMEDIFAQLNKYSRYLFGDYLKLVPLLEFYLGATRNWGLTKCSVRGLFRNGQGAAELTFGSDTAALFLLILSSPLVLTPQSVRTQFRMAWICFGHGKVLICCRVWCCHTRLLCFMSFGTSAWLFLVIPGSFGYAWLFRSYLAWPGIWFYM